VDCARGTRLPYLCANENLYPLPLSSQVRTGAFRQDRFFDSTGSRYHPRFARDSSESAAPFPLEFIQRPPPCVLPPCHERLSLPFLEKQSSRKRAPSSQPSSAQSTLCTVSAIDCATGAPGERLRASTRRARRRSRADDPRYLAVPPALPTLPERSPRRRGLQEDASPSRARAAPLSLLRNRKRSYEPCGGRQTRGRALLIVSSPTLVARLEPEFTLRPAPSRQSLPFRVSLSGHPFAQLARDFATWRRPYPPSVPRFLPRPQRHSL